MNDPPRPSVAPDASTKVNSPVDILGRADRWAIIAAALLALFLGALDTLVMGAAMPTIVSDLGGIELYSWVFSTYLLSRAVSLPIFGKLADLFSSRHLFGWSIAIFIFGSLCAGISGNMPQLIASRAAQGIGAGGIFSLVYILLADIAPVEKRGKMMSAASFVWGLASLLGPPMGGLIVNYWQWRWIFFINIPLGVLSFFGIYWFFKETRHKSVGAPIDVLGCLTLAATVLPLLTVFLLAGKQSAGSSYTVLFLSAVTLAGAIGFYFAEKSAKDPILPLVFFRNLSFALGNAACFASSFAIFGLAAYSPLFIQGALGKTPAQLGLAMVPLSLAWSGGALVCGQLAHRWNKRAFTLLGAALLLGGCALSLLFSPDTSITGFSLMLTLTGAGMGFVSLASLLIVQESMSAKDLGVATSAHQLARTLGGTIGIGVSGGLFTARFVKEFDEIVVAGGLAQLPSDALVGIRKNIENLFNPDFQARIPLEAMDTIRGLVGNGVAMVFWTAAAAALVCLVMGFLLPKQRREAP